MRRKFDEPLRKKLSRLEANGKLYVALAEGSEVPYLSMPLKRPQDIETSWDELLAWQDFWRKAPKASDGLPLWHVDEKRKQTVSFGKQLMPVRVFIDSPEDAMALLGLTKKKKEFLAGLSAVESQLPSLRDWSNTYFVRIFAEDFFPMALSIARFMLEQEQREGYLREMAITGVDTKFLENRNFLVRTLWNALFPENTAESSDELWEKLFVQKVPTPSICVRSLDEHLRFAGVRKLFLSQDDIADFLPPPPYLHHGEQGEWLYLPRCRRQPHSLRHGLWRLGNGRIRTLVSRLGNILLGRFGPRWIQYPEQSSKSIARNEDSFLPDGQRNASGLCGSQSE